MSCPVLTYEQALDIIDRKFKAVIIGIPAEFGNAVLAEEGCSYTNATAYSRSGLGAVGVLGLANNTLGNSATLSVSGAFSAGVFLQNGGTITNSGSITGRGLETVALGMEGTGEISNTGSLNVSGRESAGIFIDGSGDATNAVGGKIVAKGREAIGVGVDGDGFASNSGVIKIVGNGIGGVGLSGDGAVSLLNTGAISVSAKLSFGMGLAGPGQSATNVGSITTTGTGSGGIFALGDTVSAVNAGTVKTTAAGSTGIAVAGFSGTALKIGNTGSINHTGTVKVSGPNSAAILAASNNATVAVSGAVRADGDGAIAVAGFGNGITVTLDTVLKLAGENATGLLFGADSFYLEQFAGKKAKNVVLTLNKNVTLGADQSTVVSGTGDGFTIANNAKINGGGDGFLLDSLARLVEITNAAGKTMSVQGTLFGIVSDGTVRLINEAAGSLAGGQLADLTGAKTVKMTNKGSAIATASGSEPAFGLRLTTDKAGAAVTFNNTDMFLISPDGTNVERAVDISMLGAESSATLTNTKTGRIEAAKAIRLDGITEAKIENRGVIAHNGDGIDIVTTENDASIVIENFAEITGKDVGIARGTGIAIASSGKDGAISVTNERKGEIEGHSGITIAGGKTINFVNEGDITALRPANMATGISITDTQAKADISFVTSGAITAVGRQAFGVDIDLTGAKNTGLIDLQLDPGTKIEISVAGDDSIGARVDSGGADVEVTGRIQVLGNRPTGLEIAGDGRVSGDVKIATKIEARGGSGDTALSPTGILVSGVDQIMFIGSGEISLPDFSDLDGPFAFGSPFFVNFDFQGNEDAPDIPQAEILARGMDAVGLQSLIGGHSYFTLESAAGPGEIVAIGSGAIGVDLSPGDTFVNYGLVSGTGLAIKGGAGSQVVANSGRIEGGVDLGGGADLYISRAGIPDAGGVAGGAGFDTLIIETLPDRKGFVQDVDPSAFTDFEKVVFSGASNPDVINPIPGEPLRLTGDVVADEIELRGGVSLDLNGYALIGSVFIEDGSSLAGAPASEGWDLI